MRYRDYGYIILTAFNRNVPIIHSVSAMLRNTSTINSTMMAYRHVLLQPLSKPAGKQVALLGVSQTAAGGGSPVGVQPHPRITPVLVLALRSSTLMLRDRYFIRLVEICVILQQRITSIVN